MKYRKKPVVVEAIQFDGDNFYEVEQFAKGKTFYEISERLFISTLEGEMLVSEGDYIIKGVEGEFYPCKPDIFHKTYEEVEE